MQTVRDRAALEATLAPWRRAGEVITFVPTMGNLHDGHVSLVTRARGLGDRVVASIFVNPLQFGDGEDYDAYPRTLDEDSRQLAEAGVDVLFAPAVGTMYPEGSESVVRITVEGLSDELCGHHRPGHFTGVATVVAKLFNLVRPDVAVFGEKDYQQVLVIRRMAGELCFPVQIETAPTVREPDGLAMSSRNRYLEPAERQRAGELYGALRQAAADLVVPGSQIVAIQQKGRQTLESAGFRPDYFEVRRATDLAPAGPADRQLMVLVAAWLGDARLIDNLRVELPEG